MEREMILGRAAAWMQARGWKQKLAKRRGYEQSLFEHDLGHSGAVRTLRRFQCLS